MDFWVSLTLKEILIINDKNIFSQIIDNLEFCDKRILNRLNSYKIYIKQLKQILDNNINIDFLNNPITFLNIMEEYETFIINNTSHLFFNKHLTILYPRNRIYKANNSVTCCFSGEIINKNSEYIYYRPLLDDLNSGKTYIVTPTIKISPHYEEYLPTTIRELEEFQRNLIDSYSNDEINYYDISCNLKTDCFRLQLLLKP